MDVPRFYELIQPSLAALHQLGGSASIDEIVRQVIEDLELPREVVEKSHTRGNRTSLEYRLAWARTCLKKYGLINNSDRGVWSLTRDGLNVSSVDPHSVVSVVRQQTRETGSEHEDDVNLEDDPVEPADSSDTEMASWRDDLLDALLRISPDAFERLCQRLLRESGFIEVEVTDRSGDGGIDGHGIVRVAGLINFNVLFQSKRIDGSIGPNVVRDFRGAMIGRADKGLIISTRSFTRDARKEATRDGAPPIDLIDGDLLVDKLKAVGLGVKTKQVEAVEVDRDWFEAI